MARRSKARAPCCRAIDTANARSSLPDCRQGQARVGPGLAVGRVPPRTSVPVSENLFEAGSIGGGESFLARPAARRASALRPGRACAPEAGAVRFEGSSCGGDLGDTCVDLSVGRYGPALAGLQERREVAETVRLGKLQGPSAA